MVAHIAVLGYWLGSELVINRTFRYLCWQSSLAVSERDQLMDLVMHVDQHVRYALALQLGLGFALAFLLGYLPGGSMAAWLAGAFGSGLLILVEVTHRQRKKSAGQLLAITDRLLRYILMAGLLALAAVALLGKLALPAWLSWKLLCFVGVMACGIGIRLSLIQLVPTWSKILSQGSTPESEQIIRRIYAQSTSILGLLWVFIALIVWLSVWKPF